MSQIKGYIISDPAGNYDVDKDRIYVFGADADRECKSLNDDLYEDSEDNGEHGHYVVGVVYRDGHVSFDC